MERIPADGQRGYDVIIMQRWPDVLSYATGARRRIRPGWLIAIGLAQAIIGVTIVGSCPLSMRGLTLQLSFTNLLSVGLVFSSAVLGIGHTFAGALLLTKDQRRPDIVRLGQRVAIWSLVPLFLYGAFFVIYGGISAYRKTDMFAGAAMVLGTAYVLATGILAIMPWVALRILRRDVAS